jgi:hypothetical protein
VLIAQVPFQPVCKIEAERDDHGDLILYTPHTRYANPRQLRLHDYGAGPFVRLRLAGLPQAPRVYAVVSGSEIARYIGRARDSMRSRWGRRGYAVIDPRNCYIGGQSTNCRINALIRDALERDDSLSLWFHHTADPNDLERQIICDVRPLWNIVG